MSETLILDLTVPGEPMGKARPRLGRSGHVYTPKNTIEKQQQIAYLAVKNGARMSYLPIPCLLAGRYQGTRKTLRTRPSAAQARGRGFRVLAGMGEASH